MSVEKINLPNALLSSVDGINDIFQIADQFCTGSDSRSFDVHYLRVEKNLKYFYSTIELDSLEIEFDQKFDVDYYSSYYYQHGRDCYFTKVH